MDTSSDDNDEDDHHSGTKNPVPKPKAKGKAKPKSKGSNKQKPDDDGDDDDDDDDDDGEGNADSDSSGTNQSRQAENASREKERKQLVADRNRIQKERDALEAEKLRLQQELEHVKQQKANDKSQPTSGSYGGRRSPPLLTTRQSKGDAVENPKATSKEESSKNASKQPVDESMKLLQSLLHGQQTFVAQMEQLTSKVNAIEEDAKQDRRTRPELGKREEDEQSEQGGGGGARGGGLRRRRGGGGEGRSGLKRARLEDSEYDDEKDDETSQQRDKRSMSDLAELFKGKGSSDDNSGDALVVLRLFQKSQTEQQNRLSALVSEENYC